MCILKYQFQLKKVLTLILTQFNRKSIFFSRKLNREDNFFFSWFFFNDICIYSKQKILGFTAERC